MMYNGCPTIRFESTYNDDNNILLPSSYTQRITLTTLFFPYKAAPTTIRAGRFAIYYLLRRGRHPTKYFTGGKTIFTCYILDGYFYRWSVIYISIRKKTNNFTVSPFIRTRRRYNVMLLMLIIIVTAPYIRSSILYSRYNL